MTNDEIKTKGKEPEESVVSQEMVAKEDYLRLAADFENYRKGQAKLQEQMTRFASLAVVTQMLDVLDLMEQALGQVPETVVAERDWFTGLKSVREEFEATLVKAGAERITTRSQAFDPVTMEAVGTASGGESQTVQSEQRAGWSMHGRVIRPARVIVNQ